MNTNTKLIKIQTVIAFPNLGSINQMTVENVQEDINSAIETFNNSYTVKIVGFKLSPVGSPKAWKYTFLFEVPVDYVYNKHLIRSLSQELYHGRNWKIYSRVKTRLFSILSVTEVPDTTTVDDLETSNVSEVRKHSFININSEIVGDESIINLIKYLIEHGNVRLLDS